MGKQKRVRTETTDRTPEKLCGCNPNIVTRVLVVVGLNAAVLDKAIDKLDTNPYVCVLADTEAREGTPTIFKPCIKQIPHLATALRDLVDVVEDANHELPDTTEAHADD